MLVTYCETTKSYGRCGNPLLLKSFEHLESYDNFFSLQHAMFRLHLHQYLMQMKLLVIKHIAFYGVL